MEGEAVFLYDDPSLDTVNNWEYHQGYTPASVTDPLQKEFDFLQEVINQVLTRKRDVENYELIEEDGYYLEEAEEALAVFKEKFKHEINTNVDYTLVDDDIVYGDADTTTTTFRKLMKDYNKVGSPVEVEEWLNKVVDKETLVGTQRSDQDNLVNDPANNITDTGLLELYENVVEIFINEMIGEADVYTSTTVTDDWIARTGEGPSECPTTCVPADTACEIRKCTGEHGAGMSYCFGGKQTVATYNQCVSSRRACNSRVNLTHPTCSVNFITNSCDSVDPNYQGNLDDTTGQLTGSKKYAGLKRDEYHLWLDYLNVVDCAGDNRFDPGNWAGIDCSGLVQRSVNEAEGQFGGGITNSEVPNLDTQDAINACMFFFSNTRCANVSRQNPLRITDPPSNRTYNFSVSEKAKRGDLVSYSGHISIFYTDPDWRGNYRIMHAYGISSYQPIDDRGQPVGDPVFSRKVLVTRENIGTLVGFGRIKLWN